MADLVSRLVDYLAGEVSDAERDVLEEELFAARGIGPDVAALLAVLDGIRHLGRAMGGALTPVMRDADVRALEQAGLRIVQLRLVPGQVLEAGLPDEADFLVARLALPEGREPGRLSVAFLGGEDTAASLRLEVDDAPWDAETGEVVVVCHRHVAARDRVTCFRVRREGETEPLADYVIAQPRA